MIDITKATYENNDQLLDLLARCPSGTSLVVRQERFGDFFQRQQYLDHPQTWIAWDGETAVGVMECGLHRSTLDGEMATAGCLCGTVVDPAYRRLGIPLKLLKACEGYFEEMGADFGYCSVAQENLPYLGLLSQQGYMERTKIQQSIYLETRRGTLDARVRPMEEKDLADVAGLMNQIYGRHDMFPGYSSESLAESFDSMPGFSMEHVFVVDSQGDISACLGYWPVSSIISSVVLSWDPKLRALIGASRQIKRWIHIPHIPETGEAFRHCIAYPLAYKHSPRELEPLWPAVCEMIRQKELGSLIAYHTDSLGRFAGGYTLRAGTRVLLMKSYTGSEIHRNNPVFIPPME